MEVDAGSGQLDGQLDPGVVADDVTTTDVPTDGHDDDTAVATEPRRSRSRLASRGWLVGMCTTLVVLAVAVGAGGYLALRAHDQSVAAARAEDAAMQAAKDCVTATQAPDTSAMEASQRKIIQCATGDFSVQATLYSSVLVDAYQASNAQVQVSDLRAAVERQHDDGSIDVLVAMRVAVTNSATQNQEAGYRLRVTMTPADGTYKIARLDQVTK
jgi:Mce-associated membrane protein